MVYRHSTLAAAFLLVALLFHGAHAAIESVSVPAKSTAAVATAVRKAASNPEYQIGLAPKWVMPVAADESAEIPLASLQYLLMDNQTRVAADGVVRYERYVRRIADATGLQRGGQIQIEFDPSFQKLSIHQLSIWRDGRRIEKLERKRIKLLQRETELERLMMNGRVTASVVLDDVRVGDRVEWAYSVSGNNPVFESHFVDVYAMAARLGSAGIVQVRVISPESVPISHRVHSADISVSQTLKDGWREILVKRRYVPFVQFDPLLSAPEMMKDVVEFSNFSDWADVAKWADKLFFGAIENTSSAEAVAALARQLGLTDLPPADRLDRALEFVQKEIRYFATEMGIYSHQPATPELVLRQRFGDCKDKAALLVALLRNAGISAHPVLVSTFGREHVRDRLVSPLAFDHAITVVELDGKNLWLDPTRTQQTGPAARRQVLGLGYGLVAKPGSTELLAMPAADGVVRIESKDALKFQTLAEPGQMEVTTTFFGEYAEWLREMRAAYPADQLEKQLLGDYVRVYPNFKVDGQLGFHEVPGENAIRMSVTAELGNYWRLMELRSLAGDFSLISLISAVRLSDQTPRTRAMRLQPKGIYRHSVSFEFGDTVYGKEGGKSVDENSPYFGLSLRYRTTPKAVTLDGEVRLTTDTLPAGQWTAYRDQLTKVSPRLSGYLQVPPLSPEQFEKFGRDLKVMNEQIDRGRIRVRTADQHLFRQDVLWTDALLAAGRLPPKLKAEILNLRGVQLDHLGEHVEALRNLQEALALDEKNPEIQTSLGTNALMRHQDGEAIAHADMALALAPNNVAPRYTRAWAHYFAGNYARSETELGEILKSSSEVERSYASIWLYLTNRRLGKDGAAAVQSFLPASSQPSWPYPILQLMQNTIDFDAALKLARDDKSKQAGRECELYFYAAQRALIENDLVKAKRLFKDSVGTEVVEFNEHAWAKRELERL